MTDIAQLLALFDAGRYADAARHARALIAAKPDSGLPWKILGITLMREGQDALEALQTAAQLLPGDAEVHGNLGKVQQQRRQLRDAVASYRRALAIEPEMPEVLLDMGNALRELGQVADAMLCYRQALEFRPQFAEAHCNLGNALRESGDLQGAIECCVRAIELRPTLAEAHNNLANALGDLGRLDEAVTSYERALMLKPKDPGAHLNLAKALRLLGRSAESMACCRTALELKPDSAATLAFLGELHADEGKFPQAEGFFRRALAIEPRLPDAWIGIARYRRMTPADREWLESVQRLLAQQPPARYQIPLRFAIGKYFDDTNDFARAFDSYRQANEQSRRHRSRYDPHQLTSFTDDCIRAFDRDWFRRSAARGVRSPRPVFIVGMPRSGTTLAEQILASHPAVFGAGELKFWSDAAARHAADARWASPAALATTAAQLPVLANEFLALLRRFSTNALRVVDKMPTNFLNLGMIHAALPDARFIHMRRDPIDTGLSIYFQHFPSGYPYANDLGDIAHFYGEYERLMHHWRSVLPDASILDVSYEALVGDPEIWSRRMVEFLGLPWDPSCLNFHQTARAVTTSSKWQVRQKIHHSSVGRWRHYESFLGPLLELRRRVAKDPPTGA